MNFMVESFAFFPSLRSPCPPKRIRFVLFKNPNSGRIFRRSLMTLYEGGGALYNLGIPEQPEMCQYYDQIAQFILERKHQPDGQ